MKTVADTLEVSRSNLAKRAGSDKQRSLYHKADDAWLLPLIRRIADSRPTYGYRRVGALLNQGLASQGQPPVNHKRVYRVMRQNSLLLARHTGCVLCLNPPPVMLGNPPLIMIESSHP